MEAAWRQGAAREVRSRISDRWNDWRLPAATTTTIMSRKKLTNHIDYGCE